MAANFVEFVEDFIDKWDDVLICSTELYETTLVEEFIDDLKELRKYGKQGAIS